jgi:DNA-binding transcriptional LysR family regulator
VAQAALARLARERPALRVRARQDNTGALARLVAAGELEIALGFCAEPLSGVQRSVVQEERAVLAVGDQHPLARTDVVALADLAGETFALVDAQDGAGYNAEVREHCRAAGFEPRAVADPHGPLAWETAVRLNGCVGLTTRASSASTAQGVRLLRVEPPIAFAIHLLTGAALAPGARAFVGVLLGSKGQGDTSATTPPTCGIGGRTARCSTNTRPS